MKKFNHTAIAALTHQRNIATAVLSFSVGAIDTTNSNRVQILPDGYFKPTDGRDVPVVGGQWLMDAEAFVALKANAEKRVNDYLFDYEHQTLYTEKNGKPAPSAGWFKKLDYVPGEGLFAVDVDWTPKAKSAITDKEYRYSSAVFSYDTQTGRPISLLHVALTNDPAVDGMKAITALKAQPTLPKTNPSGEEPMNEAMKLFLDLIGVAHDGVDFTDVAALKKVQELATTAIAALKTKADRVGTLESELSTAKESVVALKANGGKSVDLSQFVPVATYAEAMTQIAALKSGSDENSIEQLLKDNGAKIYGQADRDYLERLGKENGVAALKAAFEPRVAIAALTNTQTKEQKPAPTDKNQLSAEDKTMADMMGVSHEDLAKYGA